MLMLPTGEFTTGQFGWVRSVTQALRELSRSRPITAAGDNGAINVWYQDGFWNAQLYQYMVEKDSFKCRTKKTLKVWLAQKWPVMEHR